MILRSQPGNRVAPAEARRHYRMVRADLDLDSHCTEYFKVDIHCSHKGRDEQGRIWDGIRIQARSHFSARWCASFGIPERQTFSAVRYTVWGAVMLARALAHQLTHFVRECYAYLELHPDMQMNIHAFHYSPPSFQGALVDQMAKYEIENALVTNRRVQDCANFVAQTRPDRT